jgi:DNA-binding GntR family transcriptional regulator
MPSRVVRRNSQTSLRDQVTNLLRNEIYSGYLKAGMNLNEEELARRFGVSKTPVREALGLLMQEGLVTVFPRKGAFVVPITVQDVHNYFNLRMILECAAVEQATAKLTKEQVTALEVLSSSRKYPEEPSATQDRNMRFHSLIARASGNERLAELIERLLKEMERLLRAGYVHDAPETLMAALRDGDSRRAVQAMKEHILMVRDNALTGVSPLTKTMRANADTTGRKSVR